MFLVIMFNRLVGQGFVVSIDSFFIQVLTVFGMAVVELALRYVSDFTDFCVALLQSRGPVSYTHLTLPTKA